MVYRTVLTLCTSGDRDYELNTVGERGEPFSYKVPETLKCQLTFLWLWHHSVKTKEWRIRAQLSREPASLAPTAAQC